MRGRERETKEWRVGGERGRGEKEREVRGGEKEWTKHS